MKQMYDFSKDSAEIYEGVLAEAMTPLEERKPKSETDLDMATFLAELQKTGEEIEIPGYKKSTLSMTGPKVGEKRVEGEASHGPLLAVLGNKELFSFSVRIMDNSVENEDGTRGAYRTFMMVDQEGNWNPNWKDLEFKGDLRTAELLSYKGLFQGDTVSFENFVHPNRWTAVFGKKYLGMKHLMARLALEKDFVNIKVKQLLEEGIKYPTSSYGVSAQYGDSDTSAYESKKVDKYEFEVDDLSGQEYSSYPFPDLTGQDLLVWCDERLKWIRKATEVMRFHTRLSEYAYIKFGNGGIPSWIPAGWAQGYKPTARSRKEWNAMTIGDYRLRFCKSQKTIKVPRK